VKYEYSVINADNPEDRFERHVWGEGLDAGDKGFNKCSTIADKFFYFRLFQIPTGDDPDAAGATKAEAGKQPKGQPAKTRPAGNVAERKDGTKCERCGQGVVPIQKAGEVISVERILAAAQKEHGKKLCANCQIGLRKNGSAKSEMPAAPQPNGTAVEQAHSNAASR
jgi:hypothetical protein